MLPPSVFQLLRNILADSRSLTLCYFDDFGPETDLTPMDLGIRSKLTGAAELYDSIRQIALGLPFGSILLLRDQFRLTTALFRSSLEDKGLYTIGPFRSLPYEEADYADIRRLNGMNSSEHEVLKFLLQPVPCNILRTEVHAIAKNILLTAYGIENPEVEEYSLERVEIKLSDISPATDVNLRVQQVERTYHHEELLMQAISAGDEKRAMDVVKYFINSNIEKNGPYQFPSYLQSHRSLMYASNTLFRKAAQATGVHPLFLDEISRGFAQKLSLCATHEQLNALYLDMIQKYCQLCRDQTTKNYSPNIRKIMHYVQINFREDLTPDLIAEAVHFSPNYVSRRFKEETGISLVQYINQCRIRAAQSLLEQTTMTVREIANLVGVPDWNYFTKIFKKEAGCTPSIYRRKRSREISSDHDE